MNRLASTDIERVRVFLEETAVPCDLNSFGSVLLPAVQRLVPSVVACYAQFDPTQGILVAQETYPRMVPGKDAEAFTGLMSEHPVIEEWNRIGATPALRRSDLVSRAEWHQRGLYQHIYKTWGCEDSMPVGLPAPEGLIACLCSERDIDFTDVEVELIRLVQPHVGQMYRSAEMLSLIGQASGSGNVFSILVDKLGRPLVATQTAWDLIAAYFPGHKAGSSAFPRPLSEWLQSQLTRIGRASMLPQPASPYSAITTSGDQLVFRLIFGERTGEQALLVLDERTARPEAKISPELGLSRREQEVLLLVRVGRTSAEIADILFLSRRTVEKHLENIYLKLDVDNRTAAVTKAFSSR